jgi:chlorobactene glucosyltransferase
MRGISLFLLDSLVSIVLLPVARAMWQLRRAIVQVPIVESDLDGALVSVIVPARNEERAIERCVQSLLAQNYPCFEVVVLNDRSTDDTGRILARLHAADGRLRVLEGKPLPDGWVGKCWAAHQAARVASGAWLLFVDADTRHHPAMLRSCIAYAEEQRADLLSLGPNQELGTFWERALLPAIFGIVLTAGGSVADVNDPRKPLAKAVGQFMLFRGDVYRRIGGYESVKDEIVDDFALARRIKGTGHRLVLVGGRHLVTTRMYRSLRDIWLGFNKNSYAEARRHPAGVCIGLAMPWLVVGLAPGVLGHLGWKLVRRQTLGALERGMLIQSAAQCSILLVFSIQLTRLANLSARWALGIPMGLLFFSIVLANSTLRALSGRGVVWRGRSYAVGGAR